MKNKQGLTGVLSGNPRGFAFVVLDNDPGSDIYIAPEDLGGAMHRDRVRVRIKQNDYRFSRSGYVEEILVRANQRITGILQKYQGSWQVVPDDRRLTESVMLPGSEVDEKLEGFKAVAQVTRWHDGRGRPLIGKIAEILGDPRDPRTEMYAVMSRCGIDRMFSRALEEEADRLSDVPFPHDLEKGRRDLRDLRIVTIDGEDARDLDDAISIRRRPGGGYRLGVHIADVSVYVEPGSPLDLEAYRRGTSVYFPDLVSPMLPAALSNGSCSLNAGQDRLAFSVMMDISPEGDVTDREIFESRIHVAKRAYYSHVYRILEHEDPVLMTDYGEDLVSDFRIMAELASLLYQKRISRGSVDFDFPECGIVIDEQGRVTDVYRKERTVAEKLIEEFMLLCNETVAEHFYRLGLPFLYRIHEDPDEEKMKELAKVCRLLGFHFRPVRPLKSAHLRDLMGEIQGTPHEKLLKMLALRSLPRARYANTQTGHFGLASRAYCHFTSPIRRYPDLVVHRLLKQALGIGSAQKTVGGWDLGEIAAHCSLREQVATDAEREVDQLRKVEFMQGKEEQEFDAVISGLTDFGIYVELDNTVEGLIKSESLGPDIRFHPESYTMTGRKGRIALKIGDSLKVKLVKADTASKRIDFEWVQEKKPLNKGPARAHTARGKKKRFPKGTV